jgi:oligogalacturonide transport system permease protein
VLFTLISSICVAYGFARFDFPGRTVLFSLVIATLLLPNSITIIPRYLLFNRFRWLDSYQPFHIPALFATGPFFIFLMVQFLRGIPRELDEAAYIDGCGSLVVFVRVLIPLCKPVLFSAAIFQFVWTWNDFLNTLIYISSVSKYPVALALKMSLDISVLIKWNEVLAMSLISIIPSTVLFFSAQNYFVEGIATTGLKG